MLPFAATSTPAGFTFMGLHQGLGVALAIGMACVTLVMIFTAGVIPLMRFIARTVEAIEVILGTEAKDGLVKRLDQAERDRDEQTRALEANQAALEEIHVIVRRAGLLNGKGDLLVQNVNELMRSYKALSDAVAATTASQAELSQFLLRHASESGTHSAALWAAVLEERQHPTSSDPPS